jgi:hypothetical protein
MFFVFHNLTKFVFYQKSKAVNITILFFNKAELISLVMNPGFHTNRYPKKSRTTKATIMLQ